MQAGARLLSYLTCRWLNLELRFELRIEEVGSMIQELNSGSLAEFCSDA